MHLSCVRNYIKISKINLIALNLLYWQKMVQIKNTLSFIVTFDHEASKFELSSTYMSVLIVNVFDCKCPFR